jgi:hypothetical protein
LIGTWYSEARYSTIRSVAGSTSEARIVNRCPLCRGCGQSWEPWDGWRDVGSRDRTEEDLAVIAAEEARYNEQHGDCHEVRYGVPGSPVLHCGWCCPPTPLGPIARAKLRAILDNRLPNPNLVRWSLTLSCDHAIEAIADEHHQYKPASGSSSEVRVCTTCGETRAVIAVEHGVIVRISTHAASMLNPRGQG